MIGSKKGIKLAQEDPEFLAKLAEQIRIHKKGIIEVESNGVIVKLRII